MCVCTGQHARLLIGEASSPRTRPRSVGACTLVRGLFSMLMLSAQNLLTQRLRASATFTFAVPELITMKAPSDLCLLSEAHKVKIKGDFRLGLENAFHCLSFFLGRLLLHVLLLYPLLVPVRQQLIIKVKEHVSI